MALNTRQGLKIEIEIEDTLSKKLTTILIDFSNPSIWCKLCLVVDHRVRKCTQFTDPSLKSTDISNQQHSNSNKRKLNKKNKKNDPICK